MRDVADPLADDVIADAPVALRRLSDWQEDPDLAPPPVRRWLRDEATLPSGVDRARLNRGAAFLRSCGLIGPLVLVSWSLPLAYASPVGNKPLAWTRDLTAHAPVRLFETARWWRRVIAVDGMVPGQLGHRTCQHVRLAHAAVRARLGRDPRWAAAGLGIPIPQADLAATALLFGPVLLDGLQRLGVEVPVDVGDCVSELFDVVALRLGVFGSLRTRTWAAGAARFAELTRGQPAPDHDSRALVWALFDVPNRVLGGVRGRALSRLLHGVAHDLHGPAASRSLGIQERRSGRRLVRWAGPLHGRTGWVGRMALASLDRVIDGGPKTRGVSSVRRAG